nr:molybdopterin dinucleotide binding domain-containing protein [Bradyrhizobium sp. Leo170]
MHITDGIAPGVVQLPTGAWYDPMDPEEETPLCVHGNANVLTRDIGTSSFAQRLHRPSHDCRGGAVQRQSAADPRFRSDVADVTCPFVGGNVDGLVQ